MRTLSLADCIQLDFSGSVLKNGVCFGDVNNDGLNEFVIGSTDGNLGIFRNSQCIIGANDLGEICGITIGDLLNIERNVLVVVSIDGWCHVFDVEKEIELIQQQQQQQQQQQLQAPDNAAAGKLTPTSTTPTDPATIINPREAGSDGPLEFLQPEYKTITPFHSQRIPPNAKTIHLADVNGDGLIEMVVGLTDRVLRTYHWKVEMQEQTISQFTSAGPCRAYYENPIYEGNLEAINKWEFPCQICSTALFQKKDSTFSILVVQPGGNLTEITEIPKEKLTAEQLLQSTHPPLSPLVIDASKLSFEQSISGGHTSGASGTVSSAATSVSAASGGRPNRQRNFSMRDNRDPTQESSDSRTRIIIEQHDLYSDEEELERRNQYITSEVIGNVKSMTTADAVGSENNEAVDDCYAVSTLDGTVVIVRNSTILWKLEVEQQIFALAQINGKLLTCAWSGETYFINSKECIKFNFEEPVLTFTAGLYGVREDFYSNSSKLVNQHCLAYVTYNDKVFIYPLEPPFI